jgi:DNA-binding response OmpR family regulator
MPETVLIIEDEPALLRGLKDNFEFEGYRVLTAADGEKGLSCMDQATPDLIVLDIMLPKINGYEICRLLRNQGVDVPIIMLTAKGQESDIVLGLKLGADDYVTKPFSVKELLARAEALLRRNRAAEKSIFEFGEFKLDRAAKVLSKRGQRIDLTPKEFAVLDLFTRRAGRALSRDEILRRVWGANAFVNGRSVDRCINTLRGKIENDVARPRWIQTVRETGYRFEMQAENYRPPQRGETIR